MSYKCTLSKELQLKAKKELNEDPERRQKDIEHIREWIKKQSHLNIRTDDWFILQFLRGSKFSLERTKEKIDMHYTIKSKIPEWFEGRDPQDEALREIFKLGVILPLRETDDKGRSVIFIRQGACPPDKYSVNLATKAFYMLIDVYHQEDENHSICGIVNVMDVIGMTAGHMLHYPPTVMKKSMVLWQDGYTQRVKGLHCINTPSFFEKMFQTFKVLMKDKMQKRVRVHGSDLSTLYKEVPQRILPKEYGGDTYTIQEIADYWLDKIDKKRDWILEDQKNTVDESKRPGKPKNTEDLFGIDGSFRKLNVD